VCAYLSPNNLQTNKRSMITAAGGAASHLATIRINMMAARTSEMNDITLT